MTPSGAEPSEYMNLEPKDLHIYQNTSLLNINPRTNSSTSSYGATDAEQERVESPVSDHTNSNDEQSSDCEISRPPLSSDTSTRAAPDETPPSETPDIQSPKREGPADMSTIERKYRLYPSGALHSPSCHNQTRTSDVSSLHSQMSRSDS